MDNATLWWITAALLVGAELLTGTFFLLMISLGAVMAALLSYLGLPLSGQIASAAIVSSLAVVLWIVLRSRRKGAPATTRANATRNKLDIGGTVTVEQWLPDATAQVFYRGAPWTAVAAQAGAQPGQHRVVDIVNNRLVVEPVAPASSV